MLSFRFVIAEFTFEVNNIKLTIFFPNLNWISLNMKASVIDNGEQIFIENIPELKWKDGRDTSFIGSAQLTLNSLGVDHSYEYLMGISGTAFRFHFHPDWCPSAADVTTGFDVSGGLF